MDANPTSQTPSQPKSKVWQLFAYFVGLFLFGQLTAVLFEQLQASGVFEGFAKVSQVIASSLDYTHNRDDAIATVWSLMLAALLVFPLGWVYTYTKAKEGYDKSLVQTIIIMAMVVSGMMMLIQDQFSRALALVGVVSAVRFRTNLRDTKDAVYFLLSVGIGMGTGLQVYRVAGWMTIVMCITFLLMDKFSVGEAPAGEAGFVEVRSKKKDKKKKKDKQKFVVVSSGADQYAAASSPTDRYSGLADALEDDANGVRRPNAALIVEAVDAEAAMGFIREAFVANEIPWHLVSVTPRADTTTLEYLVRVDGDEMELAAISKYTSEQCGTSVRDVQALAVPKSKSTVASSVA